MSCQMKIHKFKKNGAVKIKECKLKKEEKDCGHMESYLIKTIMI